MANTVDFQIVQSGPRNAAVRISGTLDSDLSLVPLISPQDFLDNEEEHAGALSGFRVDFVEWSMSDGIEILLEWNSLQPQQILAISGRGKINPSAFGGLIPNDDRAGYDGTINLKTTGFGTVEQANTGAQNFSVFLELIKIYQEVEGQEPATPSI